MAYFPDIPRIEYEGPQSRNPLAFRWYNPDEVVEGKTMKDHLRFSIVYWHTMRGTGSDPFGAGTMVRPWDDGTDSLDNALRRLPSTRSTTATWLPRVAPWPRAMRISIGSPDP